MRIGVLIALVLLSLVVSPVWSAEFFVDGFNVGGHGCSPSNPGTSTQPVCTIAQGRALLNAAGGGNKLWIRGGNYSESIIVSKANPLPSGSSWANATVLEGYTGETVQLSGGQGIGFSPQNDTPLQQLFQYIILKNFKIQGGSGGVGAQGCGFDGMVSRLYCGAHFIRFDAIEVSQLGGVGFCPGGAFGNGFGATDIQFVNVTAHDGGGTSCAPQPNGHGFYVAAERTLIDNAHVYNMTGYGIQNFDSGCPHPGDGIRDCGKDMIIRNSSFHHNGSGGWGGIVIAHGPGTKIYNNTVYNNHINNIELGYASTKNVEVYNNTVYSADIGCGICIATAAPNAVIKNNIIANNPTAIQPNSNTSYVLERNLCTSAQFGCELVGDPKFKNPSAGEFQLDQADSAARNTGTTSLYANTDKAGAPRPQPPGGNPDIGAYEYPEGGPPPLCPAACPTTCISPTECPPTTTPTAAPIYLSDGTHGDVPTDSGDCTVPENSLTPRATLEAAMLCMQVPGKVLYIRGGTYPGKINAWGGAMVGGIAADNPTRIEGYGSEVVTIELNEDGTPALFFNGISYVTVRNIIFDAMSRTSTNGLSCLGADHLKILNSTFRKSYFEVGYFANCDQVEVGQSTFHTSATKPVIGLEGTITNTIFDQLTVYNGPVQGIAANAGNGSNASLSILRTQIRQTGTGAGGAALDLGPGTGATLVNNILDHNNAGVRIRSGAQGTKLYHNAVASNTGVGIQCDSGASSVTISNNISFGNGTDSVVNNCSAMLASNLATEPRWVNVAACDFHLQTTPVASPALDQLSTVLPEAQVTLDGVTRPVNFLADLGPHEQGAPAAVTPPSTVLPLVTRFLGMWY